MLEAILAGINSLTVDFAGNYGGRGRSRTHQARSRTSTAGAAHPTGGNALPREILLDLGPPWLLLLPVLLHNLLLVLRQFWEKYAVLVSRHRYLAS